MAVGDLNVLKSGYFYRRKKRLSKAAIDELFRSIRQGSDDPTNNLFCEVRQRSRGATWSAISFFYHRDPNFLTPPPARLKERICAFMFVLEYQDFVVVFKSGIELPSAFKSEYLAQTGADRVERTIAKPDATFEQLRLRNMSASKHTLRSKTLEADDLENVVGPSGASRYVPQSYRVRRDNSFITATPNTGRISLRADRARYEELITWSIGVINELSVEVADISPFIRSFARPVDLNSIPGDVRFTNLLVNVPALSEELFADPALIRLVSTAGDKPIALDYEATMTVLAVLDEPLSIGDRREEHVIIDPRDGNHIGAISVTKSRISLRSLKLPEINDICVQLTGRGDDDVNCIPLKRYIDQNDLFTVLLSDFTLTYIDGSLYRDEMLVDGGARFLTYIRTDKALNDVKSEKGAFTATQRTFDRDSVFGVTVESITAGEEVLVCDDLGDEWADFIGIDGTTRPKTVSFYHAKHGELSLSASAFHVSVSQAIKNIGRMALSEHSLTTKRATWARNYRNDGVETSVVRFIKGDQRAFDRLADETRMAPDSIRRVFIVTSSLSRGELERTLKEISEGAVPKPHFVQLYWLLMSYFSACTEAGAYGYVICRE